MSARAKSLNGKQDLSNTDIEYPGLYVRLGDMRMRSHTRRDFMKTAIAATIAAGLHASFGQGQDSLGRKPRADAR